MSVNLEPSSQLAFQKPFTQLVKQHLRVMNPHGQPVAFKVKTTAPKQYCVRPNSGRIEPGESMEVQVLLQPMKEDPPLNVKCKDKFLVQSTFVTPARESPDLNDLWTEISGDESSKIHQQKLKVVYLPADGVLPEEDEQDAIQSSFTHGGVSRFNTVRQYEDVRPNSNGHHIGNTSIPIFDRPSTPPPVVPPPVPSAHAPEEHYADPQVTINEPIAPPVPRPFPTRDLAAEYATALNQAHAEIARLKELLARDQELRRRKPFPDDSASVAETEGGASVVEQHVQPEGVPLNVVALLSICVFLITYLWF